MNEMSTQLRNIVSLDHNTLLQYYTESSFARLKAVWYVHKYTIHLYFFKNIIVICFNKVNIDIYSNYVTNLFENKKKCLLYAHHQNILNAICNVAESMKIK